MRGFSVRRLRRRRGAPALDQLEPESAKSELVHAGNLADEEVRVGWLRRWSRACRCLRCIMTTIMMSAGHTGHMSLQESAAGFGSVGCARNADTDAAESKYHDAYGEDA
jgi:hypothetical protein